MAAFMEASDVGTPEGGILQFQFKIIATRQGLLMTRQFSKYQIQNCPFKQNRPISNYPFRAARTVTDDFVSKGGDGSML